MATYENKTGNLVGQIQVGDVLNYTYIGSKHEAILPMGSYKLEVWGAKGGNSSSGASQGGLGGYSVGVLSLLSANTLFLYCGGAGGDYNSSTGAHHTKAFNGGGRCGWSTAVDPYGTGGGGGGGTDIRIGQDSLYARVIVAGGGGGAHGGTSYAAGSGGGATGGNGLCSSSTNYSGGGTQTAGGICMPAIQSLIGERGTFGQGGDGCQAYMGTIARGGGGGGGWYGGAGGASHNTDYYLSSAGGGGSGYVYTSETASNYPEGCLLDSSMYLTNASTSNGINSGNGRITITYISKYSDNTTGDLTEIPFEIGDSLKYTYTQTNPWIKLPKGSWKFELWGSQSGEGRGSGGYAVGTYFSNEEQLYITCGGRGGTDGSGGYNGGGIGKKSLQGDQTCGGGGATHIAFVEGLLSTLESQKDQIVMVAGGGGGYFYSTTYSTYYDGGTGGGEIGGSVTYGGNTAGGGTQTSGGTSAYQAGSFGKGGDSNNRGGGGGGWYGGGAGTAGAYGGGGGSGYVNPNYLTSTSMANGENSDTGYIIITYLSDKQIGFANKTGDLTDLELDVGTRFEYSYTETNPWIKLPKGTYKLEVWGGQGGTDTGGRGGYSVGNYNSVGTQLYIACGGQGSDGTGAVAGGYNGGAAGRGYFTFSNGGGGGATHISLVEGLLSTLESQKDKIIIVAGGGGGGGNHSNTKQTGGAGGGTTGGTGTRQGTSTRGEGGTQTAGGKGRVAGSFGQGGTGGGTTNSNESAGGGGGGFYGGGGGGDLGAGGGGGSGYVSTTYLTESSMQNGINSGQGKIIITYISDKISNLVDETGDLSDFSFTLGATLKYTYTGTNPWIKLPKGSWQIECWGAKGGDSSLKSTGTQYSGGNGGYSVGTYFSNKEQLYICIGAAGTRQTNVKAYNGGGAGAVGTINTDAGGGGGATHVALASGLLKDLASQKSDIIIVAGGGGGGGGRNTTNGGNGGSGGGEIGGDGTTTYSISGDIAVGKGGTQTASGQVKVAGGFGYGGDGYQISENSGAGGGGGGWYGGAGAGWYCGGGGGSGHVNETYLSATSMANGANAGNGYIIFTYISEGAIYTNKIGDLTRVVHSGDVLNYTYTGTNPSITLPKGEYLLEVWGAKGYGGGNGTSGGIGGYSIGKYAISQTTQLYLASGGVGNKLDGGYNGGGDGNSTSTSNASGFGGGATHIALVEGVLKDLESNKDKVVIVAGGGGSGTNNNNKGGDGGGLTGGSGNFQTSGGSQTAAGYCSYNNTGYGGFGYGGSGKSSNGGGGGGGWYGGGSAWGNYSGGGGSGYISTTYLTEASTQNGVNSDAGRITITVLRLTPPPVQIKINGTWTPIDTIKIKINGEWK